MGVVAGVGAGAAPNVDAERMATWGGRGIRVRWRGVRAGKGCGGGGGGVGKKGGAGPDGVTSDVSAGRYRYTALNESSDTIQVIELFWKLELSNFQISDLDRAKKPNRTMQLVFRPYVEFTPSFFILHPSLLS